MNTQKLFKGNIFLTVFGFRNLQDGARGLGRNDPNDQTQHSMKPNQKRRWQYFATVGAIAIIYFLTAKITLSSLGLSTESSPLWPPAGIALAALLLGGRKVWPGVAIGTLWLNLSLEEVPWLVACSSAGFAALEAVLGALFLHRLGFRKSLERLQDVLGLVVLASIISPLISATLSNLTGALLGFIAWPELGRSWWNQWLGDGIGILIVTPLLITLRGLLTLSRQPRKRIVEGAVCLISILLVSWVVFALPTRMAIAQYPLEYLPFPFLVWAALRFYQPVAILASFIVSSVAMGGAIANYGPFVNKVQDSSQAVILLQAFIIVITVTTLVLAAAVRERQQSEMRFIKAFASSPDSITIATLAEGRLIDFNDSFLRMTGYSREEVLGRTTLELNLWSNLTDRSRLQQMLQEHGSVQNQEFTFRNKFGELMVGLASTEIIDLSGELCALSVVRNITERKLAEEKQAKLYQQVQSLNANLERQVEERTLQLQQKMEELQALNQLEDFFLHAIAHDLRTTVMGTLLVLKNLQSKPGETVPLARTVLERMTQGGEHQLSKLNSLLEAYSSRIKGISLEKELIPLGTLVQAVTTDLEPLFAANQVNLTNLVPKGLPLINADPTQLRRVFEYLLNNTVKHNPPGVQVTLRATVIEEDVETWTFRDHLTRKQQIEPAEPIFNPSSTAHPPIKQLYCAVEDTGIGICQEKCDHLFELRTSGANAPRQLTGISLGLYLCRQIIDAHGGQIGVDSTPGSGTKFWFTLPFNDQ
ncbi:MAG: PAS domain S-box protein [Cyanothece sp. SIO1E1]|nr:PAS domain S-box protein [Cyanothece sp. SIO1E1]